MNILSATAVPPHMEKPKDASEIIANIEAIDWQLSKPGAMALSRGWSEQEVAAWAIRANDARAHLVSHLVELRSEMRRSLRVAEDRAMFLAREKDDALRALAVAKDEASDLRDRLAAALHDTAVKEDVVATIVDRIAAMDQTTEHQKTCAAGDRVVELARQEVAMRVEIAMAPDQKTADLLRGRLRRLHVEQQCAMGALTRWCRNNGTVHAFAGKSTG